jgi:hypothetical protein
VGALPLPERFLAPAAAGAAFARYRGLQWADAGTLELERFLALLDDTAARLAEAASALRDAAGAALRALRRYRRSARGCGTAARRAAAVLLALASGVCAWGELSLAINRGRWSLFNFLSRRRMPALAEVLGLSTPALAYLLFVGAWSLTHLRLGSFFRFTAACTNSNTPSYFAAVLCRLGPTIGFHYVTQIGATGTQLMQVMGVMEEVIWVGGDWNIYAPVLLGVAMLFFALNGPARIAECCGWEAFSFDYSMADYDDLATGEEVLMELDQEARAMIDGGLKYRTILNGRTVLPDASPDPWAGGPTMDARLLPP